MRAAFFLLKNREKPEISTKNRIFLRQIIAYFCLFLSSFEAILPQIHSKIGDRRVLNIIRRAPPHDLRVLERTGEPPLKTKIFEGHDLRVQNPTIVCHSSSP